MSKVESAEMSLVLPFNISGRNVHRLVYKMQEIQSSVRFRCDSRLIDAKSLIGLLSAQLKQGNRVQVICYDTSGSFPEHDLHTVEKAIKELAVMDNEL